MEVEDHVLHGPGEGVRCLVQAILGHRSATQTLDSYGHLYPSDLDALAERLDRAHAAAMAAEVWPREDLTVLPNTHKGRSTTRPYGGDRESGSPIPVIRAHWPYAPAMAESAADQRKIDKFNRCLN